MEIKGNQPCSSKSIDKPSAAKGRWKILAKSLTKHKVGQLQTGEVDVSVRRFRGFELVSYEKKHADDMGIWFMITEKNSGSSVQIRYAPLISKGD